MSQEKKTLIVITGPTASGKSALAVSLAQQLGTEIISADSRQLYKSIPIATAVLPEEERGGVSHYLLEILDLDEYYSAARFVDDATQILNRIFENKDTAIICGGAMLYLDALINGIDELPTVETSTRANLMEEWKSRGDDWLVEELKRLDPEYYKKADMKNLKRLFHAVEVSLTAGKPYSELLTGRVKEKELPFRVLKFCLTGEREKLFERINRRTLQMIDKGLEEEARKVYDLRHLNSLNTVGLKEMFKYFEGEFTKEEAISRIQKNTRVYAKKQLTWHKRDENILYLDFSSDRGENIGKILKYLETPALF